MDKLTSIRIKYSDGTYLDEVPIGVLAQNVGYDSGHNLIQVLGSVDVDSDGTIQQQINKLFNEKLNSSDLSSYVNSKITTDVSTWLANNVNPVGSAVIVDQSLSISGAAADSKKTGDEINDINEAFLLYSTLDTAKRKFLPSETDLNTVLTPGEYKIETLARAKTMVNLPYVIGGILTVSTLTSRGVVMQTYRTVSSRPVLYTRGKANTNAEWGEWRKTVLDDDFESVAKIKSSDYITISTNTDLNTITTPGDYKVATSSVASTLINTPLTGVGFNLKVFNLTSASTICQLAIGANANLRMFSRIGISEKYSNWKEFNFDLDIESLESSLSSMGVNVVNNTVRITALENSSGTPQSYYYTPYEEQEQALYDKVNNDIDNNTLVFVVSTDNHYREVVDSGAYQVYHAEVMAKIAKRLRADAIINLGDIITQYIDSVDDPIYAESSVTPEEINTQRLAKMATAFQSTGVPFLYTLAHHEMCLHVNGPTSTDHTTQTSVYPYPAKKVLGLCGKGSEWLEEHHYTQDSLSAGYYVDFDRHKIRIIFYDSVSYTNCGYTPESIAFISEAFSTVPQGYKVLICTHVASRAPGVYSAQIKNWEQVETIMQDFTSNGGTILGELHGHSHFDNVVWIDGVPYPYICICCAENSWSTVGEKIEAGVLGNPVSYRNHSSTRGAAIGTYNEWLFDVVCVHPDTNTIKLFRFGIGEDRVVSHN